ncbi:MAG: hypothetical protein E7643_01835 [Ruminococcaceae bacterium]|nr:hypothetical protein [Oscillospiraceae bacterium]
MSFLGSIIEFLDTSMTTPTMYGWFHILWLVISIAFGILLCALHKGVDPDRVRRTVLAVAITVMVLEIYKFFNFSFDYTDGAVTFDFYWSSFPWQFCSMPMYVGLLAGIIKRGRVHDSLCAFLATYAVFAGAAVMLYPSSVFIEAIGINIQTMVCHGSMISIGIYLYYSGHVKAEHKTILKALPVFAAAILVAIVLNEIGYVSGLCEEYYFNMFYISPHEDPHLPVYSLIQPLVPYPLSLVIYIIGFTLAAYVMLLLAMGIRAIGTRVANKVRATRK